MGKYPEWLDDLFYTFGVGYGALWLADKVDDRMWAAKKSLWYESLRGYDGETIRRATLELVKTGNPTIREICKICERMIAPKVPKLPMYCSSEAPKEKRQPCESPVKEWWLEQQQLKTEAANA